MRWPLQTACRRAGRPPDAGLRADPRRDDGYRRCLPGSLVPMVPPLMTPEILHLVALSGAIAGRGFRRAGAD